MDDRKIMPTDGNLTPLYGYDLDQEVALNGMMVWDTDSLSWVKMQQPILEAGNVTIGEITVGNFPETQQVSGTIDIGNFATAGTFDVNIVNTSIPVTGTFFQETQPVSLASSPLPTGAATSAKQDDIVDEITNKDLFEVMRQVLRALLYPGWLDRSANAIRNQVQSGTVTTVTTVTNQTNVGSFSWNTLIQSQSVGIWANSVRRTIT